MSGTSTLLRETCRKSIVPTVDENVPDSSQVQKIRAILKCTFKNDAVIKYSGQIVPHQDFDL